MNEIVLIDAENDEEYSENTISNIKSWGADLTFRELITMWNEDELQKPEIQRKYVWEKVEASRFIESILMGLPIPSIFLAKTKDENSLIVDGFQRIMTVYDYVTGIFQRDGKVFKLSNSKRINEKWRNKSFNELIDSDQKKIRSKSIHAIIFDSSHPIKHDNSLYQIFERINTGGRTLMSQEIRNCIYQGWFNKLLIELNKNQQWRELIGEEVEDSRMKDIELILRFLALSNTNWNRKDLKTSISLKTFLNDYMEDITKSDKTKEKELTDKFKNTIKFVHDNFGENAFKNISVEGKIINKIHPTVFDSIMIASYLALVSQKTSILANRSDLFKDEDFKEAISIRTTNVDSIKNRISIVCDTIFGFKYA